MISIPIYGNINISLPPYAAMVLDRLHGAGYEAYVVGGCVRDSLLGRCVNDWDVTTSAPPDVTLKLFSYGDMTERAVHALPTGIAHGTVAVVTSEGVVEVTTFRIDGGYSDGRRPDSVAFTRSLADDLRRRDFTVNAIAYDIENGIIDPLGGRRDLENKLLRAVGDANRRFDEDALRILRALRFTAVLGFNIENTASDAIRKSKDKLTLISRERIQSELVKLLYGAYAPRVIASYGDVIGAAAGFHLPDGDYSPLTRVSDAGERLAAFFICADCTADAADDIMHSLRFDNAARTLTAALIGEFNADIADAGSLCTLILRRGYDFTSLLLGLRAAFGRDISFEERYLRDMRGDGIPCGLSGLAVGGSELIDLGLRGREIGAALNCALEAVVRREISNERAAVISYIKGTR